MAVKVDGELWQHAFECGLLGCGAVLSAALVAPSLGFATWQVALAEGLTGLIGAFAVLFKTDSMPLSAYWLLTGLCAAGWSIMARLEGVWNHLTTGLLAGLGLALTPAGAFLWASYRAEVARRSGRQLAITANLSHKLWIDRFAQVDLGDIIIREIEPTFAGHAVHLRLPMHGHTTLRTLKSAAERMETAWNLREGALRFAKGGRTGSGEVVMHVTEKDVLQQLIPYPQDLVARSINEPFPVGMLENGDYAMVQFREIAALLVGVRGAGKSNLLNVLIAQLAQCVDCVIWMIDLKGGRAAGPWLESWVADHTGRTRPVLDWVATTPEEAELMLDVLAAWIDYRSRFGGGKEKVIPSVHEPAIVLIVDEMAKVFGQGFGNKSGTGQVTNSQLAAKAKAMVTTGRSEAIDAIFATQRGTVTMTGDGDLKSQLQLRIGLGTTTTGDAMSVYSGDVQAQKRMVAISKIPGAAIIEHETELVPFKTFRIEPDKGEIRRVASWCEKNTGAAPEDALVRVGGSDYADRWGRQHGQDLIKQVASRNLPDDEDEKFEDIVAAIETVNPVRARVRDMVISSGRTGVSPNQIMKWLDREGYRKGEDVPPDQRMPARETVNKWLTSDSDPADGMFEVRHAGTTNVRYVVKLPRLVTGDETDTGTDG
jgi:hypothetical protein